MGTVLLTVPPWAQELGGADVHTSKSGVADHFAENEPEAESPRDLSSSPSSEGKL